MLGLARDALAGLVASIVLIANIISFGALMFPGALGAGASLAIWSMLIGSSIAGIWVALRSSLPPIATGIDSPTGAVLVLVATNAATGFLNAGTTADTTIQSIMLLFTLASLLTGAFLYVLGRLRLGSSFRFTPFFVVAGFLAATGWFLLIGALRMTMGTVETLQFSDFFGSKAGPFWASIFVFVVLIVLRTFVTSASAIPITLVVMTVGGGAALSAMGLSDPSIGWYFPNFGRLSVWWPWSSIDNAHLRWDLLWPLMPEWLAVAAVALMSLVTKVSTLEVSRRASADLDCEFRIHGAGTLAAAPLGGMIASVQTGTSRLLEQSGGVSRMSGVFAAVIVGLAGISNFDFQSLVPVPLIAGLVFYLAYTFFIEALLRPIKQRAWRDFAAAIAIMIICAVYGYLLGVLAGLIGACLLFALSYARIGTIRRHVDRTCFQSSVDRSLAEMDFLRAEGFAIQLYWLSGYIFFGSSESVFETIKRDIEDRPNTVRFVILDFRNVTGADTSAIVSLTKLLHFCEQQRVTLAYCSLAPGNAVVLEKAGLYGGKSRHRTFRDSQHALSWCEDQLLAQSPAVPHATISEFPIWLQRQIGNAINADLLLEYFERRELVAGTYLYRSGDVSDTLDIVAAGSLSIDVKMSDDEMVRRRRITTHTVLGEMGFFRGVPRSATVLVEDGAVVFTLTRTRWEKMLRDRPDVANALYHFVLNVLSDRIEFSNREIAALSA